MEIRNENIPENPRINLARVNRIFTQFWENLNDSDKGLIRDNFSIGKESIGKLGMKELTPILQYQEKHKLNKIDGIIGVETLSKLRSESQELSIQRRESVLPMNPEKWYSRKILDKASTNLGAPYNTSARGQDGFAREDGGVYHLRNNYTGRQYTSDKNPFTCSDFVFQMLQKIGIIDVEDFMSALGSRDPYDMQRVEKLEQYAKKADSRLEYIGVNMNIEPTTQRLTGCRVGDMITTQSARGGRHMSIVSQVDGIGNPVKCIHASGTRGRVAETAFWSTRSLDGTVRAHDPSFDIANTPTFTPIKDVRGAIRTDGVTPYEGKIIAILRPSNAAVVSAMNAVQSTTKTA